VRVAPQTADAEMPCCDHFASAADAAFIHRDRGRPRGQRSPGRQWRCPAPLPASSAAERASSCPSTAAPCNIQRVKSDACDGAQGRSHETGAAPSVCPTLPWSNR
jgi:hypothetical protein